MVLKNFFSMFADSDFLGRPYKINRLLFGLLAIFILIAGLYIRNEQQYYPLAECLDKNAQSCNNNFYGSEFCKLDTQFASQPICTQERIFRNPETGVAELGLHAPWYVENYTTWVLALFVFAVIFNTLVHNFHLFRKQTAQEKEEFVQQIEIGKDGKPIVKPAEPVKEVYITGDKAAAESLAKDLSKENIIPIVSEVAHGNINQSDNGSGQESNSELSSGSNLESINVGNQSGQDATPQESSVEASIEQDGQSPKSKARGRPRKRNSKD